MTGEDILNYMRRLTREVFGFDLDDHLRSTGRKLYGFVSDQRSKEMSPLFGDPTRNALLLLKQQDMRVGNSAAGHRSALLEKLSGNSAGLSRQTRELLTLQESDFDVFFIADDVIGEDEALVKAIVFHETCHLVEQAGMRSFPFVIEAGCGRSCYESLAYRAFRENHTAEFIDLFVAASSQVFKVGEPFRDELDVISKAMHYDYEGDVDSARALLQTAVSQHLRNKNLPGYFEADYLPRIDSLYRNLVKKGDLVEIPDEVNQVQGAYMRPKYYLREEVYNKVMIRE